ALPLALIVCFGLNAPAQTPSAAPTDKAVSASKAERKNRAPVSKEVLRVKLPKPIETKLDNGLTVLILEDHRLPNVTLQFLINGAGPLDEPADRPGLASTTAQMLREGTATRQSKQIAEESDRLGATVFASSGFGSPEAVVSASGLSDNFDQWFALATDVLLHPSFPAGELNKLKQRQLVSLRQQRSSPAFLGAERFNRAVYGTFPAAIVSATPESIQSMTAEMLANWHRERYVPQNAILGIAGDVDAAQLIPKLKKALAEWKKTDFEEKLPRNPKPATEKRILLVNRPNSVQTNLILGNIAIDRRSPDYIAMTVMNRVLGGGPAGRLFLKLREDKGYTYGAYSTFASAQFPGPWRATSDVRTEVTDGAMTEFMNELRRIREEKVPAAELQESEHSLVAGFALSLEQPAQLLGYAITRKIYNLPDDYWDTYPAKIAAVTADDVERVAKKYLDLDTVQIVAVGDAGKIKTILEKYGPVTVYDTEGKVAPN
ncbi:MAG: insulinase family protein, partial [Acidobacteriota bacterium]|nr:insulinase family protein [Acidobacteriota bacterium]